MNYLLDKKLKRKKYSYVALGVIFSIILFYFRVGIFEKLSFGAEMVSHPVIYLGKNISDKFGSMGDYFASKSALSLENENLRNQISASEADRANYVSVVDENIKMKEILNRKNEKASLILAPILSKPNQSVYDTLIIDGGINDGIKIGNIVFAFGNVPIGKVDATYEHTARVILFSSVGEKIEGVVSLGNSQVGETGKNNSVELIGRGGNNFEMILPRDLTLQKGDQIVMPGINNYVLAIFESTISDPRDPFNKVLLSSPVNIEGLKFVEVEK